MVLDTTTGDHPMPKTNGTALTALVARQAEVDAMLERLAALRAELFGSGL